MIQRIIKTDNALNRTLLKLQKTSPPLEVVDTAILHDIEKYLETFEKSTVKSSGNSYVTISLIISITYEIYSQLNKSIDSLQTQKGKLLDSIRNRLFLHERRSVPRISTILNTCFKEMRFSKSRKCIQSM